MTAPPDARTARSAGPAAAGQAAAPARRWTPTPFVQGSMACHAAAALGMAAAPSHWPWLLAAVGANQALITAAGLLPRLQWLGPSLVRLPNAARARREVALTIDDGPDPRVTPAVLDLLDAHQARASFFCIGHRAREHPALCREIVARGHRVENHGDAHAHAFAAFGPWRMHADIATAQATLADVTGQAPLFFRPTAGLRNPFLDPVLHRLGLSLAAWTRRPFDTRTGNPDTVLARLLRGLDAGDILLLHDGHAARGPDGRAVILATLPRLLQQLRAQGLSPVTLQHAIAEGNAGPPQVSLTPAGDGPGAARPWSRS